MGLEQRLQDFTSLIEKFDATDFTVQDLRKIIDCVQSGLTRSYYTQFLNRALDPFAQFFAGEKPGSFSNAVQECLALLSAMVPESEFTVVEDEADEDDVPNLRLLEDPPLSRIDPPKPYYDIIPDDTPKVTIIAQPAKRDNRYMYGGLGILGGLLIGYILRKATN
jgi:hypothetical protein